MANKPEKKLTLINEQEMQIKPLMSYLYIPTRMVIIKT